MKKHSLIFSLLFCLNLYSQDKIGLVQYGHKQSMGMGAAIGVDYNATLTFDNYKSLYTFAKDSLEGGHLNKSVIIKKDKDNVFVKSKRTSKNGYRVYVQLKKEMQSRNKGYSYVKEEVPKIEWKISNNKKNIGNFECIKATASFRGRNYTAWFTKSIPLAYGPWKLQGLPGLILEAYDTNKEVYFYFKSIKYPLKEKIEIPQLNPYTENQKWISFDEYKVLLKSIHTKNIQNGRLLAENYDGAGTEENEMPMINFFIEAFDE